MFYDYYAVLEISQAATKEEIKKAFKIQSLKWHPDKNHGVDTNDRMLLILEAYHILVDNEKRKIYDETYTAFIRQQKSTSQDKEQHEFAEGDKTSHSEQSSRKYSFPDFEFHDEVLKEYIREAQQYAKEKIHIVIDELKGSLKSAATGAVGCLFGVGGTYILTSLIIGIIFLLLSKGCSTR